MQLTVNGEPFEVADGASITDVLTGVGVDPRRVAVERNREIAPKSSFAEARLNEGDTLEIVHFIGGG